MLMLASVDKPEPPPAPILNDDELSGLVDACRGKKFAEPRRAVIRLLIDCGLRVSEVTGRWAVCRAVTWILGAFPQRRTTHRQWKRYRSRCAAHGDGPATIQIQR